MQYIAFMHKEDNDYVAVVPDLGFTSSYGETFAEAVEMIKEAAELYCEDLKTLPKTSTLEELMQRDDLDLEPDAILFKISINISDNSDKWIMS